MQTFMQDESIFATFQFEDQFGTGVTPTAVEYIVSDVASDTEVYRGSFVPTASTYMIQLDATASEIEDDENNFETKVLNWYFTFASTVEGLPVTGVGSGELTYRVRNLFADKT